MALPARTIAMMNQKGGVGKTTSTVNLGAAIARGGRRVCLIDLDPQAHMTLHLGIDPDEREHTIYDLLLEPDVGPDDVIVSAGENLDVIPAIVDLAAAESELAAHADRTEILSRQCEALKGRYDFILLDCPPSLGLLTLNALAFAREVFVPMQPHFLALQGVGKLLETVGRVSQQVNTNLRVTGVIVCMHEGQTTLAREVISDLDQFFEQARGSGVPWADCRVLRPPIRRNIKLAEAPSFGQSIYDYSPWCPGAIDYRALAESLIEEWDEVLAALTDAGRASTAALEAKPDRPADSASTDAASDDPSPDVAERWPSNAAAPPESAAIRADRPAEPRRPDHDHGHESG